MNIGSQSILKNKQTDPIGSASLHGLIRKDNQSGNRKEQLFLYLKCFIPGNPVFKRKGYNPKGVVRTGTGNPTCPNTILVLVTRNGIHFLTFRFLSIRKQNFKSVIQFQLNRNQKLEIIGIWPEFTGIDFPNFSQRKEMHFKR
jgi:hypothetical protein